MVARSVRATWSATPASSPRGVFGVISDLLSSARGAGGRRVFISLQLKRINRRTISIGMRVSSQTSTWVFTRNRLLSFLGG